MIGRRTVCVLGAVAVIIGAIGFVVLTRDDPDPPGPPNVLVIISDDQRADHMQVMSQTRELFEQGGTRFSNAFASTPLCCPARASIFTGRYTHNHLVANIRPVDALRLDQSTTLQHHLRADGYQTALVGKYLNEWDLNTPPPDFDTWAMVAGEGMSVDGRITSGGAYTGDDLEDETLATLDHFEQADDEPWLLYLAPFSPHSPYIVAPEDADAPVVPDEIPAEADRSDKPPELRAGRSYGRSSEDVSVSQQRSLLSMDRMIGDVFERLDELGESNTLAVFVSDNGYLVGEHGITEDKRLPYTDSVQVPLLMRWPGRVEEGAVDDRLVLHVDIAPTVLEATGVALPDGALPMDGRSLLDGHSRKEVLLEYFGVPDEPASIFVGSWASLRSRQSQYIEWFETGGEYIETSQLVDGVRWRELYDLDADPAQLDSSVAGEVPADSPQVAELSRRLDQLRRCAGTTGPMACN